MDAKLQRQHSSFQLIPTNRRASPVYTQSLGPEAYDSPLLSSPQPKSKKFLKKRIHIFSFPYPNCYYMRKWKEAFGSL